MRAGVFVAIAILAAGFAAGGYWYKYVRSAPQPAAQAAAPAAENAVAVEAVTARIERIDLTIPAVGSLKSNESVLLSPEVAGRVVSVLDKEGQVVEAGTLIAALDQSIYEAEIEQAEASLALSRANYKRAAELFEKKAGTARAKDEAQAKLRADEASLALAKARFDKTRIVAPFDGVLGLRSVSVGQYLEPGDPIIRIEDIDPLKVDFRVPEVYFVHVEVGQPIDVSVDALSGNVVRGSVYAIDPVVDEQGRSLLIRATIPNRNGHLRPGLFARVALVYDTLERALTVPEEAIVPIGAEKFVFRVIDERAVLTKVEIGERILGRVEIRAGVSAGDSVVIAGQLKIGDGTLVSVINSDDPA